MGKDEKLQDEKIKILKVIQNSLLTNGAATFDETEPDKAQSSQRTQNAKLELDSFKNKVEDKIFHLMDQFENQLIVEANLRKGLISYLKVSLYIITFIPLLIILSLVFIGVIANPYIQLSAVVAIPIEIVGVFAVISKNLFADTYRTSLPDLISKYLEKYSEISAADRTEKKQEK
jgi:hypothetical protein